MKIGVLIQYVFIDNYSNHPIFEKFKNKLRK